MKTSTFTVNNIGSPEAVVCTVACRLITIGEDPRVPDWPTTDFRITGKDPGSVGIQRPSGTTFTFERTSRQSAFAPGEIVGYVETVTGSTIFLKSEQ
jgi:hypothetical protein